MREMYRLPEPAFNSELVTVLFEIERLRTHLAHRTTPNAIFLDLNQLFDIIMSVVSARIEGNHTTVYEAINSAQIYPEASLDDAQREIINITSAARFVDTLDPEQPLTHGFIRELHSRIVENLDREGDPTPGQYRNVEVEITGSVHRPPSWVTVHSEMTELIDFSNTEQPMSKQILQIAQAHHRFAWIHPFRNGNGRVSRLFTYAMLRKTVFATLGHSALNPTSVFGNDRTEYIEALESADSLSQHGTIEWATFFAKGIRDDLDRVNKLQQHEYVIDELVVPVLRSLAQDGIIGAETEAILRAVLFLGVAKAGDLVSVMSGTASQRSRTIRDLLDRDLLRQSLDGPRFYQMSLSRGPIAARLIQRLDELRFLPKILSND